MNYSPEATPTLSAMSIFDPKSSAAPETQLVVEDTKTDAKSDVSTPAVLYNPAARGEESEEASSQSSSRSSHGNLFGRLKRIGGDWRIEEANGGRSSVVMK